ncbi:MAG: hypothetical protein HC806_06355 [Anaerolineae bacterium]|nr:hypothetical protein [Anaerolineae bacterium]
MFRAGKQIARRLDVSAYFGYTRRQFGEPYPVSFAADGTLETDHRRDESWQFGFGLERFLSPRARFSRTAIGSIKPRPSPEYAFDQARFSIGIAVDLATRDRGPIAMAKEPAPSLGPRAGSSGITFRLRDPAAASVHLVGDFNAWDKTRTRWSPSARGCGRW